jgi:hypothetical protein
MKDRPSPTGASASGTAAVLLSSVFHDQRIDDIAAMNTAENKERSLVGVDHFFEHKPSAFSAIHVNSPLMEWRCLM